MTTTCLGPGLAAVKLKFETSPPGWSVPPSCGPSNAVGSVLTVTAPRSMNRAVLEKVEPSGAVDLIRLIGHGISKSAPLPTKRGPFVANGPAHLVGSGGWRPVDRSELKVIVVAQAIGVVISFVTG